MRKNRILLDVDGVLADFVDVALEWAGRELGGLRFTRSSITDHDILKSWGVEHLQECFDRFVGRPGVCENLSVLPGAKEFVAELQRRAEVVIVTSPYGNAPTWCFERLRWLEKHFKIPKVDVIFAKRKDLVQGHALVDDYTKNTAAFPGVGILIDQPWNANGGATSVRALNLPHALARLETLGLI